MSTKLEGDARPVAIAPGFSLRAPGLMGEVQEQAAATAGAATRGAVAADPLGDALDAAEMRTVRTFEVRIDRDTAPAGATTRGTAGPAWTTREGEPAIALEVPDLGPDRDYAVLHADEAGGLRWILPADRTAAPAGATARGAGGGTVRFLLPRASAPLPPAEGGEAGTRGPIIGAARRVVRVLTWATDRVVGAGVLAAATAWEAARRPYGLARPPFDGTAFDWQGLGDGRALLLIHGTFSNARGTFGGLTAVTLEELKALYGGRVFAFDHPSLHESPDQNAARLLGMLPPGLNLEVDVVTHSRGGLVGRELAAKNDPRLRVRRAVLVASPNVGTVLTAGDRLVELLDRYTNLLVMAPDNVYTLTLEGVLIGVKLAAHAAFAALPGLRSMLPGGDYLGRLNPGRAQSTRYYALAADFTPDAPGLLARFGRRLADRFVDSVFGEPNDGVVPTKGSYDLGLASPLFPIADADRHVFAGADQVHHCNYFRNAGVGKRLVEWLGAP